MANFHYDIAASKHLDLEGNTPLSFPFSGSKSQPAELYWKFLTFMTRLPEPHLQWARDYLSTALPEGFHPGLGRQFDEHIREAMMVLGMECERCDALGKDVNAAGVEVSCQDCGGLGYHPPEHG